MGNSQTKTETALQLYVKNKTCPACNCDHKEKRVSVGSSIIKIYHTPTRICTGGIALFENNVKHLTMNEDEIHEYSHSCACVYCISSDKSIQMPVSGGRATLPAKLAYIQEFHSPIDLIAILFDSVGDVIEQCKRQKKRERCKNERIKVKVPKQRKKNKMNQCTRTILEFFGLYKYTEEGRRKLEKFRRRNVLERVVK